MKAPVIEVDMPSCVAMLQILQKYGSAVMARARNVGLSSRDERDSVEVVLRDRIRHISTRVRSTCLCWRKR